MSTASSLSPALQALARNMARAFQHPINVPPDAELGAPLHQAAAVKPSAPALLAQCHAGPQARRNAVALYRRCLVAYRQRVQHAAGVDDAGLAAGVDDAGLAAGVDDAGLAAGVDDAGLAAGVDDAGLAAAYFVLANLDALHDLRPGRAELAQVERQMRHGLGASWRLAPLPDRQSGFEQLAVLGTLMTESAFEARRRSATAPAAVAHVQQAARAYLVQFGLNPQRLRLSGSGLVLEAIAA